jgi:predicted nucleic acid-binding protein
MTGKRIFVDSNILLYLFAKSEIHSNFAKGLLVEKKYFISTQVVNENVNVCIKKFKFPKEKAFKHGQILLDKFNICIIQDSTIKKAFAVSQTTNFSYWDSLIVASAIENKCDTLYSEDLNHTQIIEGVEILNPFV